MIVPVPFVYRLDVPECHPANYYRQEILLLDLPEKVGKLLFSLKDTTPDGRKSPIHSLLHGNYFTVEGKTYFIEQKILDGVDNSRAAYSVDHHSIPAAANPNDHNKMKLSGLLFLHGRLDGLPITQGRLIHYSNVDALPMDKIHLWALRLETTDSLENRSTTLNKIRQELAKFCIIDGMIAYESEPPRLLIKDNGQARINLLAGKKETAYPLTEVYRYKAHPDVKPLLDFIEIGSGRAPFFESLP